MTTRLASIGLLAATLWLADCGGGNDELVLGPCSADKPFCQRFQGRSWSDMTGELTFDAAKEYCSSIGGRLPTISELRTLVVDCDTTKAGGTCGLTDTCNSLDTCWDAHACANCGDGSSSVFHNEHNFWSSTPFSHENATVPPWAEEPGAVWTIAFRYNDLKGLSPSYSARAYCLKP
jgi:hypothetical protein